MLVVFVYEFGFHFGPFGEPFAAPLASLELLWVSLDLLWAALGPLRRKVPSSPLIPPLLAPLEVTFGTPKIDFFDKKH